MRICWLFIVIFAAVVHFGFATEWTDRKEYDLVLTIRSEASQQRRLELLNAWTKTYPKTDMQEARLELYLSTYDALGDRIHMFETARQILADNTSNPVGLYWCAFLLPKLQNPSADALEAGEKSARRLISGSNSLFAMEKKPPSTADGEWQKQRSAIEVLGHRSLGWAHWQRGEFSQAEEEFTICLQKEPNDSEVSSWLGIVLALEEGKQASALWHLARASRAREGDRLSGDQRRQVDAMLERLYLSYHGVRDGLDELKSAAAASVFPPPDFKIDSSTVVAALKAEAELSQTNPELAAWLAIRRQLEAPTGEKYFTASLESRALPRLRGTVLRSAKTRNPRELLMSMNGSGTPELVLKLTANSSKYLAPGSKVLFQGSAQSFAKEPFELVVVADPNAVQLSR